MGGITAIVQTATIVVLSILALIAAGAGAYFYYTAQGQEEGE